LQWSYSNIRGVNNLEITLERKAGEPFPVTLIMMPNGTGKTTTIKLLRATLDGSATNWLPDQVRGYRPGTGGDEGEFRVTLAISSSVYIVWLKLDYRRGIASYETTRVGDKGGKDKGFLLPQWVRETFSEQFVNRFVFDGELAKEILRNTSNEAETALLYLYRLNRLDALQATVDRMVKEEQERAERTSAKTAQGLSRLRNERDKFREQLSGLKAKRYRWQKDLEVIKAQLAEVESKMAQHVMADDTLRRRGEETEANRSKVREQIAEATQALLGQMRSPQFLSATIVSRLRALSENMIQLRLPRTMSKQFFEELADQKLCVCDRPIGPSERCAILHNVERYLGSDDIGVIIHIKTTIKDMDFTGSVRSEATRLSGLIQKRDEINSEWDRLQAKRRESGDDELAKLDDSKKVLASRVDDLVELLRKINTRDRRDLQELGEDENIYLCERKVDDVESRLAEATHTVELVARAAILKGHLSLLREAAIRRLKRKVIESTNSKLAVILQNETVAVQSIEGYLVLKDKEGASEGQTLAIAYSFLGSLFEASAFELPFVVDSPAGSLDLDVRRQVSQILPELFRQIIVFITSGERKGFAEHFYRMKDDVQFLTVGKNRVGVVECHSGVAAFESFQEEAAGGKDNGV
jgi:hypothetical protein